ncbi:MAG: SCP2 sterol-binding domain-containing protein [Acidimicrobiales bacterium]
MARFLSPSWAEEFNTALESAVLPGPGPDAGLAVVDGTFTVVEEVRGAPDGDVRVVLRVVEGSLRLQLEHPAGGGGDGPDGPDGADGAPPDVTILISYDDAVAMSKGELAVAEALNAGRIRVRGDLSVLVAAQQMLMAARSATRDLVASTTY